MKRACVAFLLAVLTAAALTVETGHALMALPDLGIDYKTMLVVNPAKLRAAGMADVKRGDKVTMKPGQNGKLLFTSERTGKTVEITVRDGKDEGTRRQRAERGS